MRCIIVGRGRLGTALATALAEAGVNVDLISHNGTPEVPLAQGDAVFLTVPDAAIAAVAARVAQWPADAPYHLVHCAGVMGTSVLGSGPFIPLALHPFQTIEQGAPANVLRSIPWGASGNTQALEWAGNVVKILDGTVVEIPDTEADRARYHATAVLACNMVQTYLRAAQMLANQQGIDAATLLGPIVRTTVEQALRAMEQGRHVPLTGPVVRGDVETIRRHIESLPSHLAAIHKAGIEATALLLGTETP
jgi:predicted short-subunit dehydrogenase-like oxidoreductase (DUF2520 family)